MITVEHWDNGNIKSVEFINEEGFFHNPNGPAYQTWFENGQEGHRAYLVDGKWHNPNGPSYQAWHENGQESYRTYLVDDNRLTEKEFLELQNTVEVTVEGKTTKISRESAKALNLIKE